MSSLSHHGIKGQRWGVRRYQNKDGTRTALGKHRDFERTASKVIDDLSNSPQPFIRRPLNKDKIRQRGLITQAEADQCAGLAAGVFKQASKVEPQITGDVIDVVSSTSAKMYGLNNRLKQPTSIAAKIGSDAKSDGVTFEQAANGLKDVIRYTAVSDSRDYVDTYNAIKQRLENKGYTEIKCKNYFQKYQNGEVMHKAVQSTFRSPDGVDFEFQFQTPESQAAKELKVPIYNERRKAGNTPERNAELEQEMRNLAEQVPDPEGVFGIESHSGTKNMKHSSLGAMYDRQLKHTSIGGTMYIEGNTLILGDSSYLEHHGILGQKWGVRRFQNKDGTRTAAGKARDQKNAAKIVALSTRRTRNSWQYQNAVTKAQDKLTNDSKSTVRKMAADALYGERKVEYKAAVEEYDAATNYRYDEYRKEADKYEAIAGMACGQRYPTLDPAKFDQDTRLKWDAEFYMYDDGDQGKYNSYDYFLVAKGENPNKVFDRAMKARNNIEGIAKKDADDILGDSKDQVIKGKVKDRTVSDELAYQITEMAISASDYTMVWEHQSTYTDDEIKQMKEDIKKYSKEAARLGLTHSAMFIEDGTLYLSHHGIRGQRWGVRRFQNRDGSLTNAGRKRLGYATKGAVQTVGKAFKAGVKAGGNAVKAAKAHHEKKEAEKLQKKKEKASKTRLGVMANKDLFTNEEIRKLNERFKLEDEMKMATLQKGVEIAKAVGTIAQNVGTVAKTYEDVTGQSLSPIKRKAAEEKARQDKEDRERRIAREDADEARKAAKEERDIAIHEQTLRKAIAAADTQEFTAQKTKAEADSSVLDAIKKGQDFNGGSDATGQSWMEKATSGGKNVFEQMKYDSDPEYRAAKDAHDEKVARKERMEYLDKHIAEREQEKQAEKAAKDKALMDMINQSNARTGRGQSTPPKPAQPETPRQDSDALFSQKGSLPIDKDRYRNRKASEKAKKVKEDVAEDRAKKQDEKAVNRTIDDTIEANRSFKEVVRAQDPHAYDRGVAKDYIKRKLNNLPNALADLNPINRAAKKIADKATKEEEAQVRKSMKDQYDQMVKNEGRDEANYVMYNTRVANLQAQGYSERKAKQIADSNPTFSAKRNRKKEYYEKVGELESTHRKNVEELHKANKELTDYYYKLVNGPGYEPGSPKREALDRTYRQKRGELERLEKDNNEMLEKGTKEAKKILEHSFSIQNGVLFIDESVSLSHHGIKGQRWGVRRFQNADGTLTEAGKKREARQAEKKAKKEAKFHTKAENLRAKDLARYDKMLSKNLTSQDRLNYTELKKYTEKASDKEVLAGSSHAKRVAIGAGIVSTIGLSISGVPNVASIPIGISIAKAINNQERDNVRIRTINAQNRRKYAEGKTREVASYVEHSALVASISDGLYLEHHGILGQKWGVRRFQDTAGRLTAAGKARLKEAKSSIDSLRPREKKTTNSNKKVQRRGAGEEETIATGGSSWEELDEEEYAAYLEWFKSLSDEELKQLGIKRSEIDAIKSKEDLYALIQKYRQKKTYNTGAAKLINGTLNALFSSNLLSVFDPAVVMGSAATAELRKKLAEHRKSKEPIDPKSGFHVKSDANASKIDDMKNVNPGFTDLSDNTKNNCMLCTTTYDLRRRGYDVTAEEVRSGYYTGDVKRWYPDAEIHQVKNYSTVDELINNTEKAISKQGDGARGNIMVTWQQGGGHSMAYEVENGKVVIYDCQTGTRYENAGDILKYTNTVSYARLDNVEPDYDKIKEASN